MTDTTRSINPATGATLAEHPMLTPAQLEDRLALAAEAAVRWRRTPVSQRAAVVARLGDLLDAEKDRLGRLMTLEMGKPIQSAIDEAAKCAMACRFYAEHGPGFIADDEVRDDGHRSFVTYQPLGVVLAVMPWNFPFWQVIRFAAPTLMAGNTAVLKHASNVPGCALAIEGVFREAGFPEDLFRTLLIPGSAVKALIEAPEIAAVTLTGSVEAGRSVAAAAGGALKKTVLELGGSDAYLVLEDADIDKAADVAVAARMVNGGQSCIAGKRFVVLASVRAAFEKAFVERMAAIKPGDPNDPATRLGPLVSVKARDGVHDQVRRSLEKGARLLTGGEVPGRPGAWYPPTVLTNVRPGMAAYDEEVFGPVAAIIEAADEGDAIRIANDSEFGLGSGVLTGDLARGERIAADELAAGMSFVNANVRSDTKLPFGGVKHSGYGRECSVFGIREFVNIKSVLIG
jgi:succinate-semialdehyde dehydrogenase/glutarate-semialdehyde dehydrogenase